MNEIQLLTQIIARLDTNQMALQAANTAAEVSAKDYVDTSSRRV